MNLWPHYHDPFVELVEPRKWSLHLNARKVGISCGYLFTLLSVYENCVFVSSSLPQVFFSVHRNALYVIANVSFYYKKPPMEPEGSFGLQKSPVIENMYIFYAPDPSLLAFDVEVWAATDPTTYTEAPFLIGKAAVLPFKFKHSRSGHIRLPLLNHCTSLFLRGNAPNPSLPLSLHPFPLLSFLLSYLSLLSHSIRRGWDLQMPIPYHYAFCAREK